MTIQALMREVLRIVGDPSGARVSKELMLILINQEAPKIAARFPNDRRVTFSPDASGLSFDLTDVIGDGNLMKVRKVMINGRESEPMAADEIERLVWE